MPYFAIWALQAAPVSVPIRALIHCSFLTCKPAAACDWIETNLTKLYYDMQLNVCLALVLHCSTSHSREVILLYQYACHMWLESSRVGHINNHTSPCDTPPLCFSGWFLQGAQHTIPALILQHIGSMRNVVCPTLILHLDSAFCSLHCWLCCHRLQLFCSYCTKDLCRLLFAFAVACFQCAPKRVGKAPRIPPPRKAWAAFSHQQLTSHLSLTF